MKKIIQALLVLSITSSVIAYESFATKPSYWLEDGTYIEYPSEGGMIEHPPGEVPSPVPVVVDEPIQLFTTQCIKEEDAKQCKLYNESVKRELKTIKIKPTPKPAKVKPTPKIVKPTPKTIKHKSKIKSTKHKPIVKIAKQKVTAKSTKHKPTPKPTKKPVNKKKK